MGTAFTLGSKGLRVTQPGRTDPAYDPNWATVEPTTKISVVSDSGTLADGIIVGQTTFDTSTGSLLIWNGSSWVPISGGGGGSVISDAVSSRWEQAYTAVVANSASKWDDVYTAVHTQSANWFIPDVANMSQAGNGNKRGNLLFDRSSANMMVWDGSSWIGLVAAAEAAATGGAIALTLKTFNDSETVTGGGATLSGLKDIQVTFDKLEVSSEIVVSSRIFVDTDVVGTLNYPGDYTGESVVVQYNTGVQTVSSDTVFGAPGDNFYLLTDPNTEVTDTDGDGVDDVDDQFPNNPDRSGLDSDGDNIDDAVDSDPLTPESPPTDLLEIESLTDYQEETAGNVVLKALNGVKLNFRDMTESEQAVLGTEVMTLYVDQGATVTDNRLVNIGTVTYPRGYAGKDLLISYTYETQPLSWPKAFADSTGNLLLTIADADSDTVPNPDDAAPEDPNVTGVDTDNDGADDAVDDSPTDDTVSTVTVKPVITLNGDNPQIVALDGVYVEDGATAKYDGGAIANPTITGAVDTTTVGTYEITYTSTHQGETSTKVRTVKVQDQRVAPYITVTPTTSTINLNDTYGETQALVGVTATDSDGTPTDITSSIVVGFPGGAASLDTSAVTTSPVEITYDVTDADGLTAAQQTRAITIVDPNADTTPPVITVTPTTQEITLGTVYDRADALNGVSVNEGLDVNNILLGGAMGNAADSKLNTASTGTRTITYNIQDAANNIADQKIRTITIVQGGPVDVDNDGVDATVDEDDNDATVFDEVTLTTASANVAVSRYSMTSTSGDVGTALTFVGRADDVTQSVTKPIYTLIGGTPTLLTNLTYGGQYVGKSFSITGGAAGGTTYTGTFIASDGGSVIVAA